MPGWRTPSVLVAASTAAQDQTVWADTPLVRDRMPTLARLIPELHPILDHPPFAPRRREAPLVWPLEAPMIDTARNALFREVRIESGTPQGST